MRPQYHPQPSPADTATAKSGQARCCFLLVARGGGDAMLRVGGFLQDTDLDPMGLGGRRGLPLLPWGLPLLPWGLPLPSWGLPLLPYKYAKFGKSLCLGQNRTPQ